MLFDPEYVETVDFMASYTRYMELIVAANLYGRVYCVAPVVAESDCFEAVRLANEVDLGQIGNTLITAIYDLVVHDCEVLMKHVGRTANSVADSLVVALRYVIMSLAKFVMSVSRRLSCMNCL
ncbi:hypothetical protein V6N12_006349 [Hibiscus sabdariffa]|uniref:RNase H type-1 domain-containing protein n=1 Tax=Hibiscus sabdariffa TaxID=183260 RepID=A0ABR2EYL1_9ROSI